MKKLITAFAVASTIATTTLAENNDRYIINEEAGVFIDRKPEVNCSNTDVIVGIISGVAIATTIGVASAASLPVVGSGYAAGATLGWSGAFSAPFFTGTTIYTVMAANAMLTPVFSVAGFYGSCVLQNTYDLW